MDQTSFFCPQCKQPKLFQSKPINHTPHILASVFLCGLWLPVWILTVITHTPHWHCSSCGFSDSVKYLAAPGLRNEEARAAQQAAQERELRGDTTLGEKFAYFVSDHKATLITAGIIAGVLGIAIFFASLIGEQNRIAVAPAAAPTPDTAMQRRQVADAIEPQFKKQYHDNALTVNARGDANETMVIHSATINERIAQELSKPVGPLVGKLKMASFTQLVIENGKGGEWRYKL